MFYFESPIQRNYYKQRISRKKTFGATIDRLQKYFLFALFLPVRGFHYARTVSFRQWRSCTFQRKSRKWSRCLLSLNTWLGYGFCRKTSTYPTMIVWLTYIVNSFLKKCVRKRTIYISSKMRFFCPFFEKNFHICDFFVFFSLCTAKSR